jgi:hypothetical protein
MVVISRSRVADRELVEIVLRCLGKQNKIGEQRSKKGTVFYRAQMGDVAVCRWLRGVGITPRKSLTLGALAVPDAFLPECARGLMEGDGSILNSSRHQQGRRTRYTATNDSSSSSPRRASRTFAGYASGSRLS